MSGWKYGLIKVDVREEGTEFEEQVNMIDAFCRADLSSLQELDMARGDIVRDGINTFFYDNGEFTWDHEARSWDWIPYEDY